MGNLRHRKLSNAQKNSTVSQVVLCGSHCQENESGYCPSSCLPVCPKICVFPYTNLIPPAPSNGVPAKSHKVTTMLASMVAVLSAIFVLASVYTLYVKCYSRRRSRRELHDTIEEFREEENENVIDYPVWLINTVGLQPSVICAITVCRYKRDDGLVEGTECSVCLSEFEENEVLRLLPKCSHAFHIHCIDTWLRSHTNCPMCRALILSNSARALSLEPPAATSGSGEGNQMAILGIAGESNIETEEDGTEVRTEEAGESSVDGGRKRNGDSQDVQQTMGRSVSVDSKISDALSESLKSDLSTDPVSGSAEEEDTEVGTSISELAESSGANC